MQIKFTRSYYLTSVRMNTTKKKINSENNKCWQGYGATGTLVYCWWEYKMAQLLESSRTALKKLKIKLPNDLAVWHMSQRIEHEVSKEMFVYSSLKQHYSQWLKHGSNPRVH